jgi:hypothetical protein
MKKVTQLKAQFTGGKAGATQIHKSALDLSRKERYAIGKGLRKS